MGETGAHFGSYRLISRLGKGGMGETWHAVRDDGQGVSKDVVIKRILRSVSDDPAFVEAFISEARLSSRLSHGNVAQVFEFGEVQGEYFMALEYIAGQSLAAALERAHSRNLRGVPPAFALYVAMEMLKGLHHAHKRTGPDGQPLHIVHRDVSPDNVLLSYEGEVKMVDFGIAKAQLVGRAETEPGFVKGKYLYFSPEQARGEPVDARTDVFATGVVLYSMLAGRLPLEGQSHVVLHKLVRGELPSLSVTAPWVPASVEKVVNKALAIERTGRFASALEFQQALAAPLREIAPEASQLTVSGMMTWLFGQELSRMGRTVVVPGPIQRLVQAHQQEAKGGVSISRAALEPVPPSRVARADSKPPEPKVHLAFDEPEHKRAAAVTDSAGPTDPGGIAHVQTTPGQRARGQGQLVRYLAIGGAAIALTAGIIYGVSAEEPQPPATELDDARAAVERGDLEAARRIVEVCKTHGPCIGGDALLNAAQRQVVQQAERAPAEAKPPAAPAPTRAQQLLEADRRIAAGDWSGARQLLEGLKPDPDAAKKLALLDAEGGWKKALDDAEAAIHNGDLKRAKQLIASTERSQLLSERRGELQGDLDAAFEQVVNTPRYVPPAGGGAAAVPVAPPSDVVKKYADDGRNQLKARDYNGARKTLSECLKVDPKAYDCAKLLGSTYAKLNDPEKSIVYYRKFLELAPPDDPARPKVQEILDQVNKIR